ncbi:hypothetical protein M1N47_02115 [Dehalococcoidia bacterium]|nr:hypothetical protein [Dehalococcoidia bacterium]
MTQEKLEQKAITIDPKEIREGACQIRKWGEGKSLHLQRERKDKNL